jgi:hypothetical protein
MGNHLSGAQKRANSSVAEPAPPPDVRGADWRGVVMQPVVVGRVRGYQAAEVCIPASIVEKYTVTRHGKPSRHAPEIAVRIRAWCHRWLHQSELGLLWAAPAQMGEERRR